jgi:mycothiol synthase
MTSAATPVPTMPPETGIAYRRYRGLEDIPGMAAANAAVRARAGILEPADPDTMRHRYTHLVNSDPLVDCLIAERNGATTGYARVEWHDLVAGERSYELTVVVEPDAWELGITETLVGWSEARLGAIAAEHPTERPCALFTFAFDGDADLERVLPAGGYVAVRWDAEMLRPDLEALPEVVVPDGFRVRSPLESELRVVWTMLVAAFAEHWGEREAHEQQFEDWVDDPRFRLDLVVVAWDGDRPVAAVLNVLEPLSDGSVRGLLDGVATHPAYRRRGLARATIAESLRRLRAVGATSAYLGVDTDNANQALTLYESCGFRVVSRGTSYRKPFDVPGGR